MFKYSLATVSGNKRLPKTFDSFDEAEAYRLKRLDPSHWKVICAEIIIGDWVDACPSE